MCLDSSIIHSAIQLKVLSIFFLKFLYNQIQCAIPASKAAQCYIPLLSYEIGDHGCSLAH
jgi:hypothetical protein